MKDKTIALAPLITYLKNLAPIEEGLQNAIIDSFQLSEIKKNTSLLQETNICTTLWFLVDGILRSYHNIGDKEVTSRIMFNNHIVISAGSFFTQSPATESIESLSDCTIAQLSFADLQHIYKKYPNFNYHGRIITEEYFYKQEQRLYMLRKHDALAKYEYFLEHYSPIIKDIPQKYIASFLNIAPETLSRVRSKLSGNK